MQERFPAVYTPASLADYPLKQRLAIRLAAFAFYLLIKLIGSTLRYEVDGDDPRPPGWLGVSAHRTEDIECARQLQADFVVLGHALDTDSHPGLPALGWDRFRALADAAGRPVFAIGGQSLATLDAARRHGAHGIAAIRGQLVE